MRHFIWTLAAFSAVCLTTTAQGQQPATRKAPAAPKAADAHAHAADHPALPTKAVCVLIPTQGNKTGGTLTLTAKEGEVHVSGKITGLTPGLHGFHIHEFGDLSSADGAAAGGHFNPTNEKHGGPGDQHRHAGDFGNVKAGDDGVAMVDIKAKGLQLHFIIGRSIVVHADADDLKSQPSGNAGARVAVGVIGIGDGKPAATKPAPTKP